MLFIDSVHDFEKGFNSVSHFDITEILLEQCLNQNANNACCNLIASGSTNQFVEERINLLMRSFMERSFCLDQAIL